MSDFLIRCFFLILLWDPAGIKPATHLFPADIFDDPVRQTTSVFSVDSSISVNHVYSILVDNNNVKWFASDTGLLSYDGTAWMLYSRQEEIPSEGLKDLAFSTIDGGQEIWIASPAGATMIRMLMDSLNGIETLTPENSSLFGGDVVSIDAGKNAIRWFGTERGISAIHDGKWLSHNYDIHYPEELFMGWPITVIAANQEGDTLYAATDGAGIARVYRDEVDAISGASVYAQWGPIILPSDHIYSIYITPEGVQWFGTEAGVARHAGFNTLENWIVYTTDDGLADNFVQAICRDSDGNMWFGTNRGLSVFDGFSFVTYTSGDGLGSDTILSMAVDHDGVIWIGTDSGISRFENGEFINY